MNYAIIHLFVDLAATFEVAIPNVVSDGFIFDGIFRRAILLTDVP